MLNKFIGLFTKSDLSQRGQFKYYLKCANLLLGYDSLYDLISAKNFFEINSNIDIEIFLNVGKKDCLKLRKSTISKLSLLEKYAGDEIMEKIFTSESLKEDKKSETYEEKVVQGQMEFGDYEEQN